MDTLAPDYPIYCDYIYVAILEDGKEKPIRSDITGTVTDLIKDLKSYYKMPVVNVRAARFPEIKEEET